MMLTDYRTEHYSRLNDRLAELRQAIIRADPAVLTDGRFEDMFVAPLSVIDIACQLIKTMPRERH